MIRLSARLDAAGDLSFESVDSGDLLPGDSARIILRGAGIAALWDEALVLAAFGVFFMLLSALRFKKHLG